MSLIALARPLRSRLSSDDRGNASIEYALLGAIVGLGIISSLNQLKRSLNVNYDKISYAIGQATQGDAPPKTVLKTVPTTSYTDGGRPVDQKWVYYTDGSMDLVRTPGAGNQWFTASTTYYDKNGVETGSLWIDAAGNVTNTATTWLGPTTAMYQQTGAGSCNCTYRSSWTFQAQPDGSNMVIYHNDLVDGTNAAAWMYQSQNVVYNSTPTSWNYIGDVTTSRTGTVTANGQSISQYK